MVFYVHVYTLTIQKKLVSLSLSLYGEANPEMTLYVRALAISLCIAAIRNRLKTNTLLLIISTPRYTKVGGFFVTNRVCTLKCY